MNHLELSLMKEFNPLALQDPSWDERFRRGRDQYEAAVREAKAIEADAELQRYLTKMPDHTTESTH
jgi:hypothetical protein